MKTVDGHINQCLIFGQVYILIVTLVLMGQVMKEEKFNRTLMISNKKWYHIHVENQGVPDGVTKEN